MVITVVTLITHSSRDASSALASPSQVQLLAQQHPITTAPRWWLHLRWSLQPKSDGNEGRPTGADAGGMGGWRGIDELSEVPSNHRAAFAAGLRASRRIRPTSGRDDLATPVPLPASGRRPPSQVAHGERYFEPPSKSERPFHTFSHASGQWRRSVCRPRDASQGSPGTPSDPQCRPGAVSSCSPALPVRLNSRYIPSRARLTRSVVTPAVRHLP